MLTRYLLDPHLRMGVGCQENQPCDQRVGTFSLTHGLQGGERGWNLNQSPTANELIDHAYVVRPTQKEGLQRTSRLMNTWRFGERSMPRKSINILSLSLATCISSIVAVPAYYIYNSPGV